MSSIPEVRNEVEVQVLNHIFVFRRLRWTDATRVGSLMSSTITEPVAQMATALKSVSGRLMTVDEAMLVITKLPRTVQRSVYTLFLGNLDPHRYFSCQELVAAPDAATYAKRIAEEEEQTDKVAEEVEEYLVNKFGQKEFDEEMELGRQIVEGTGYAGAIRLESDKLVQATAEERHLSAALEDANSGESW